ncbi:efflux RND transporter permease subunit, partial [Serratia marcescens]|uniref:efflux RND transporter permease subunit n=1 Tax=Serratia marcescens TaxID=615 RepID=UPI001F0BD713
MKFFALFIHRPVATTLLTLAIAISGAIGFRLLPVSPLPQVDFPVISISASLPGASPETMASSVATPLERALGRIAGVNEMTSMSSLGSTRVILQFDLDRDINGAARDVQAAINAAQSLLPTGMPSRPSYRKVNPSDAPIMILTLTSDTYSQGQLYDFASTQLAQKISQTEGVGDVSVGGSSLPAVRVELNPSALFNQGVSLDTVRQAIANANVRRPQGAVENPQQRWQIQANDALKTADAYRPLIIHYNNGSAVRLADVAEVKDSVQDVRNAGMTDAKPAIILAISRAPDANIIETVDRIRAELPALQENIPASIQLNVAQDRSPTIRASLAEVEQSLAIAIGLVILVVFIFLRSGRATLIPAVAVPVSLIGSFAAMYLCGFSLNNLSLMALTIATGFVVDDAIVVVENVERVMSEEGLPPREATRKSMGQIQSALVGIALVLSAVFVPMAFFGGTTGAIYRQFSITIVSAMVLSVLVAMILTPALCATLLKPIAKGHHHGKRGFFGWFNRMFNRNADRYERGVGRILHASGRYMVIYLLLLGGMALLFIKLPTSFLPQEDRGIFTVQVQLPAGSTLQQTSKVVEKVERYFLTEEKQDVLSVFAIIGSGPGGNGQNVARLFVRLKDWDLRTSGANSSFDIIDRATLAFNKINEARVIASSPPAITGLGNSSGFDMELEDHAGLGHAKLMAARDQLLQLAAQNPLLSRVRHNGLDDSPQLQIDIDQRKAQALGVSIDDINNTLSTAWGSTYVNDFVDRGRVKKVYVQAAAPFRMLPDDINKWYVRNSAGGMVPFSAFASSHWEYGSPRLERYNGSSALEIVGEAANGVSTGTAMAEMEKLVSQLPTGFGLEWTAMSYQERLSGSQAPALYAISLLVVFLCLAALYESW